MEKLTKIVATIGPSSDSEELIEHMIKSGVNVIRFNFKHSTVEWHNERIDRVKKVGKKMGVRVGILLDLQGPEIRINMPGDSIRVKEDELITLGESVFSEKKKGIFVSHPQMLPYLKVGQRLIADDGAFTFYVKETKKDEVILQVKNAGELKNRKSLRIPGADFPFPLLIDRDFDGLKLAQRTEIDYVALSYVRTGADVDTLRREMKKYKVNAQIISKIETRSSIENLDAIIRKSDGLMVARGDLGIELPIEEVPYYQKIMIAKCLEHGIPVITATQMLQSMVDNPYPTRAEVSDVANATYDLTDAVMLSGETASGKHPIKAIEMMAKTVVANETRFTTDTRRTYHFEATDDEGIICESAYNLYLTLHEKKQKINGFVVFSTTGRTARLLSRYRPVVPIYTFVAENHVADSLSVNFGIVPVVPDKASTSGMITRPSVRKAITEMMRDKKMKGNGTFIVLYGDQWNLPGMTSTMKFLTSVQPAP